MFEFFTFTNAIFMGILLLIKPSRVKSANAYLAFFLFSLSLELAPDFFEGDNLPLPETSFFTVPLLYLYVRQIILARVPNLDFLWLLPGLVINLLMVFISEPEPTPTFLISTVTPLYVLNLSLLFRLHKKIKKHQEQLLDQYTNLETRTLNWVRGLVVIFLLFNFIWMLDDALLIMEFDYQVFPFFAELLTLISVFWVGYHGLSQTNTAINTEEVNPQITVQPPGEDEKVLFQNVLLKIEKHKLYMNQELTLRLLAQQVGVNEKKLSFWINSFTDNNFYHLINQYRVAEFKQQINEPENQNLSLLGIAQNSGFRNKSTFHKVFKELEGITPNDYKKGLKQS